jgi:hypothetical protein
MGMCGNDIRRIIIKAEGILIEQVTEFKHLWNRISEFKKDVDYKLQTHRIHDTMKINFSKSIWRHAGLE